MTPDDYKIQRRLRGTQSDVAAQLGVRQATVSDRETGVQPITREAELALLSLPKKRKKNMTTLENAENVTANKNSGLREEWLVSGDDAPAYCVTIRPYSMRYTAPESSKITPSKAEIMAALQAVARCIQVDVQDISLGATSDAGDIADAIERGELTEEEAANQLGEVLEAAENEII
jgi:hypothetical protein